MDEGNPQSGSCATRHWQQYLGLIRLDLRNYCTMCRTVMFSVVPVISACRHGSSATSLSIATHPR